MSKSKYCKGIQCPKILWMDKHMPDKAVETKAESIFNTGTEVGKLARDCFSGCQTVTFSYSKEEMCKETQELLSNGANIIAEASFMYNNNFCSVDILRMIDNEVHLIEVKSSTEIHDIYYDDMAYQYYVLRHCGMNVTAVINMHINNEYVRQDELELDKLFVLEDCTEQVINMQKDMDERLHNLLSNVDCTEEPVRGIGLHCEKPYECLYKSYCYRHVKEPSVFSIHRLSNKKKYELYEQGIVTFEDIVREKPELNEKQWRQVKTKFYDEAPTIDKDAIQRFLATLEYSLYHLDFETYQQAIPQFKGVKPYMQIPFQYSLHVQKEPCGECEHYAFLGKAGTDPRRALAEQLCSQIPMNACTLAYNMSFEKTVIKNLAMIYEDLSEHLMSIHDNIHDLMVPFQQQSVYCKELQGSYSIKWVLPALCGGDPELDYHELDEIHNGSEAMNAFADLPNHSPEEIERTRNNLLAYCRLDTLAMVKILEKLYQMLNGTFDLETVKQSIHIEKNDKHKGSDKMEQLLDDRIVIRKLVETLDMFYGEGSKSQIEKILVSEVEDEFYEKYEQSLNDELYMEQKHRIRDALIACNIISYDEESYHLLVNDITQVNYDKVMQYIERGSINSISNQTSMNANETTDDMSSRNSTKPIEEIQKANTTENQQCKEYDIKLQKEEFEAYVLSQIRSMQPFEFERLTTRLLRSFGLEFYPGNRTGDDGVDGYGYLEVAGLFKFKVLVQCKRYEEDNKIANYAIRDLRGAVSTDAYKGLFVTTSSFTPRAKKEAEKFPQIDMIDGRQFVELMVKNKVGIIEKDGKYALEKDYLKHIELEEE